MSLMGLETVTDDELGCGIGSAVRLHGGGGRRRQGGREGGRERAGPASRSALAALTARSPPLPLPPPPPAPSNPPRERVRFQFRA